MREPSVAAIAAATQAMFSGPATGTNDSLVVSLLRAAYAVEDWAEDELLRHAAYLCNALDAMDAHRTNCNCLQCQDARYLVRKFRVFARERFSAIITPGTEWNG